MTCPVCGKDMTWHTDHDCILPLLNRIKQLEQIARLAQTRVFGEPSTENHEELKEALEVAGFS